MTAPKYALTAREAFSRELDKASLAECAYPALLRPKAAV
jgi:hypothetical protein